MISDPRPSNILIVEDEPELRDELAELFECRGFTVATANDAATALTWLTEATGIIWLLTDFRLPASSGLDLVRWIRSDPMLDAKVQYIAVMTGHSELTELVDTELARNRVVMLNKPVSSEQLLAQFNIADPQKNSG